MKKMIFTAAWFLATPVLLWAQEVPAAKDVLQDSMSLSEILQAGGWLMYVLAAMSIFGVALVVYFAVVLRGESVTPREFMRDLREMLAAGRVEEARKACEKNRSAVASVAAAALEYVDRSGDPHPGLLKEIMEGEGSRQASLLQNQTQYLLDVAAVAPMVGLLGTVMGMLRAFNTVALDIAKAKPMLLAGGVSQALVTTAAGLIVAIPAMVFYAFFRSRTSRLISNLEAAGAEIMTMLVHK